MAEERVTLEQTLAMASQLDPTERMKLRHALDQMTTSSAEEDPEMTFKRALLEKGLISEVRSARKIVNTAERHSVPVKGKPVSETIIEDRR